MHRLRVPQARVKGLGSGQCGPSTAVIRTVSPALWFLSASAFSMRPMGLTADAGLISSGDVVTGVLPKKMQSALPPVITPLPVLTADLALTDVYPDFLPVGSVYIRMTNNGPHSVQGIAVDLGCYLWWWSTSTPPTISQWINPGVVTYLDPGESVAVPMNAQVHTDQYQYVAGCDLGVPFSIDPNMGNNNYSENIP